MYQRHTSCPEREELLGGGGVQSALGCLSHSHAHTYTHTPFCFPLVSLQMLNRKAMTTLPTIPQGSSALNISLQHSRNVAAFEHCCSKISRRKAELFLGVVVKK